MAEPPKKRAKPAAAAAAAKKTAQSSSSYFDDLMRDVSNTHSAMQAVSTTAGSIASAGHQARAASAAVPAGENRAAAIAAGLLAAREAGLALGLDPKTAENELEVIGTRSLSCSVWKNHMAQFACLNHLRITLMSCALRWRLGWAWCTKKTSPSASFHQLLATSVPLTLWCV